MRLYKPYFVISVISVSDLAIIAIFNHPRCLHPRCPAASAICLRDNGNSRNPARYFLYGTGNFQFEYSCFILSRFPSYNGTVRVFLFPWCSISDSLAIQEQAFAMRLINARTLKLEEFWDKDVNDYAIVSHRWEDGEVSFRDMQDLAVASKMKGFTKIQKSCERAIVDSFNYVWLDTCCINKESSAELTEAIDSMYRWYERSAVCYTFLSDVLTDPHDTDEVEQQNKSSMWFTRGWTLQELLAPRNVIFF